MVPACSKMHLQRGLFSSRHCAHDGCVDLSYVGSLGVVYSRCSFICN